jgi:hypothetical protein
MKMARRLLTLMTAIFVLSTGVVAGASMWGEFDGYSKARVFVNGEEMQFSDSDVPAFITHGSTVLPLRDLSDSLQALVKWDNSNKTVYMYKPNVHMFFVHEVSKDYTTLKQPFGKVSRGDTIDFIVFAQIDNLKTNVRSFKISIKSPNGEDVVSPVEQSVTQSSDSYWLPWQFKNVSFDEYGKYTVQFSINAGEGYKVVSEKQITSE